MLELTGLRSQLIPLFYIIRADPDCPILRAVVDHDEDGTPIALG